MGANQSYQWRSNIRANVEVALESLKISELGIPGTLRELMPGVMQLHLDMNLLYSWDQYFFLIKELPYLNRLALTSNRFKRIDSTYLDGKNVDAMVNPNLKELVLIGMALDWS
jgi:hypothetical protein